LYPSMGVPAQFSKGVRMAIKTMYTKQYFRRMLNLTSGYLSKNYLSYEQYIALENARDELKGSLNSTRKRQIAAHKIFGAAPEPLKKMIQQLGAGLEQKLDLTVPRFTINYQNIEPDNRLTINQLYPKGYTYHPDTGYQAKK